MSNPKPDLHNIYAHTKFCVNPLMFTQVIIRKQKTDGWTDGLMDNQRETLIPATIVWQGIKMEWKSVLRSTISLLPQL